MYKFILYVAYRQFQRFKVNEDPRDNAVSLVCAAAFFHLFFALSIFDYFDLNLLRIVFGDVKSKYYWTPFVVAFMILLWRYFDKERTERIVKDFEARGTKANWVNTVVILLITIVPLIVGIQLLNAS